MPYFAGIDIGGTKCAVCCGDTPVAISQKVAFPTTGTPQACLEKIARELTHLHQQSNEKTLAIGISCGGPLDSAKGVILSPPNLPGWDAIEVVDFFQQQFGLPAFLQNDANACALAEWRYGAGKGTRNMMFCTMGTGFGCGLVLEGQLFEGANGNAGELGHVRLAPEGPVGYGKEGSVEGFCSGGGIAQLARMRLGKDLNAQDLAIAANQGDADALAIFQEVGRKLGHALSIAVDLLNVECIVIGSIFARAESLIRPAMEQVMQAECLPASKSICKVLPAQLGENIGDTAALTLAQTGWERQQQSSNH